MCIDYRLLLAFNQSVSISVFFRKFKAKSMLDRITNQYLLYMKFDSISIVSFVNVFKSSG